MKTSDNDIDNLFKTLENDSFQVPPSFLEDLNTRLDAEKLLKKRKRKFWLFGALLVFAAATFSAIALYRPSDASGPKTTSLRQPVHSQEVTNQQGAENHRQQAQQADSDRDIASSTHSPVRASGILSPSTEIGTEERSSNKDASSDQPEKEPVRNALHQKQGGAGTNTSANSPLTPLQIKKTNSPANRNNAPAASGNLEGNKPVDRSASLADATAGLPPTANTELNDHAPTSSNLPFTSKKTETFLPHLQPKPIQFPASNDPLISQTFNPIAPVKSNSGLWEFDAQLSFGTSFTYWNAKSSSDSFANILTPNKPALSYTIGAKWNVFFRNVNFSTGLEYLQTGEKVSRKELLYYETGIDSVFVGFEYDSAMVDSFAVYQHFPVYIPFTSFIRTTNRYSWLSVPLSFGYRFTFQSWSVIPRLGADLNIGIAGNTGKYPDENDHLHELTAVRFYADFSIQTEIRKNFDRFHVFLTPYYRGNLTPLVKSPQLTVTHTNWGCSFGAGISF